MSSLFQSQTITQDFRTDDFVSTRGGILITATGVAGTVELWKKVNGKASFIKEWPISCNPSLSVSALTGSGEFFLQVTGVQGCLALEITEVNSTVIQADFDFSAIVDAINAGALGTQAAIAGQTTDLQAAILSAQTNIQASIQAVVDTLNLGIDVNATQAGTWSFTLDNQPIEVALTPANIADLIAALEAADITTQIGGQDVVVDVNIDNEPVEVTMDLDPIVDAIQAVVRVDYERTSYCILDAQGDKVPLTGVYAQLSYDGTGAVVSSSVVLSQLVGTTWQTYVLQAGETIAECPADEAGALEISESCKQELADKINECSTNLYEYDVLIDSTNVVVPFYGRQCEGSTDIINIDTGLVQAGARVPSVTEKQLTKTHSRTTGANTYSAPYKSLTVTSLSNDVTVDGQAIPNGFTVSVDSNENEIITNDTVVTGTDYFVTEVK